MGSKSEYRKKIRETVQNNMCPEGYHWVRPHARKKKYGFGTEYVEGHCAKNTAPVEFKITKRTTKSEINTPIIRWEKTIEEQPIEKDENDGGGENSGCK